MEGDRCKISVERVYEADETAFVKRTLKPGQTFVDVGAHIGYYAVMAAKIVGPGGKVYAFEPNKENYLKLRDNAALLGDIVSAFPVAVSDCPGKRVLYLCADNSGDHRLYSVPGRDGYEVRTVSLDSSVELQDKKIDFVKIDVQGFETCVLRGALRLLHRSKRVVGIIEFSPEHLRLGGSSPAEFFEVMQDLRFNLFSKKGELFNVGQYGKLGKLKHHINLIFSRSLAI